MFCRVAAPNLGGGGRRGSECLDRTGGDMSADPTAVAWAVYARAAAGGVSGAGWVEEPAPVRGWIDLHGRSVSYLEAGRVGGGPTVVLVHGLAGNATGWREVIAALSPHAHVLVPDLIGHGQSAAAPGADYSVSAHATRLRDLLDALGHRRVHLVGHSFGGGVVMAFAYQFPERAQSMTLIASGGLGPELSVALRIACLPGVPLAAAHTAARISPSWLADLTRQWCISLGLACGGDLDGLAGALRALDGPEARMVFLATLRAVAGWSGQRLDATDRLYLFAGLPILLVAGRHDRCIPYQHALRAHQLIPGSRLQLLEAGHFPHTEHPERVGAMILELLGSGEHPARLCTG